MLRSVPYEALVDASAALCEETLFTIREDLVHAIEAASQREEEAGRVYLELLLQNAKLAKRDQVPLVEDAGIPLFLLSLGAEVAIEGGPALSAIEEGIRDVQGRHAFPVWSSQQPFGEGPALRERVTPHVHVDLQPGDGCQLKCIRLDRTTEQSSRIISLPMPLERAALREAVLACVQAATLVSEPPYIVGVGVGGAQAEVGILAQRALLRPIGKPHRELDFARVEQDLMAALNGLQLGPGGLGGQTTALAVHIEAIPTHSETTPVCIYLQTSSMRVGERTL